MDTDKTKRHKQSPHGKKARPGHIAGNGTGGLPHMDGWGGKPHMDGWGGTWWVEGHLDSCTTPQGVCGSLGASHLLQHARGGEAAPPAPGAFGGWMSYLLRTLPETNNRGSFRNNFLLI